MRHQLSLDVPVVYDVRRLRIEDSSIYTSALPVDCARLEISVPGFATPAVVEVQQNFRHYLNSCDLALQTIGCADETHILPDGIYVIRYSVSPNDKVFVEYNHLRMAQAMNRYFSKLCVIGLAACEPDKEVKEILKQFQMVRSFFDAAKAKVEYCHEPRKGMELFVYAQQLLDKVVRCF